MQLPAAMKFCLLAGILSRTFKTTAGINHRYFSICAYSFLSMPFVEKHIPTPKDNSPRKHKSRQGRNNWQGLQHVCISNWSTTVIIH